MILKCGIKGDAGKGGEGSVELIANICVIFCQYVGKDHPAKRWRKDEGALYSRTTSYGAKKVVRVHHGKNIGQDNPAYSGRHDLDPVNRRHLLHPELGKMQ